MYFIHKASLTLLTKSIKMKEIIKKIILHNIFSVEIKNIYMVVTSQWVVSPKKIKARNESVGQSVKYLLMRSESMLVNFPRWILADVSQRNGRSSLILLWKTVLQCDWTTTNTTATVTNMQKWSWWKTSTNRCLMVELHCQHQRQGGEELEKRKWNSN